jgi:hypothetical protein
VAGAAENAGTPASEESAPEVADRQHDDASTRSEQLPGSPVSNERKTTTEQSEDLARGTGNDGSDVPDELTDEEISEEELDPEADPRTDRRRQSRPRTAERSTQRSVRPAFEQPSASSIEMIMTGVPYEKRRAEEREVSTEEERRERRRQRRARRNRP